MKKLLLPAIVCLLASCDRTPRTIIEENNPKYCWDCMEVITSSASGGSFNTTTKKDTTYCDKTGIEITAIMEHRDTGTITIGTLTITNVREVRDCKKQ